MERGTIDVVSEEIKKSSIGNSRLRMKLPPSVLLFRKERARR